MQVIRRFPPLSLILVILGILVLLVSPVAAGLILPTDNSNVNQNSIHEKMLQLPLSFIQNAGQAPGAVKYSVQAEGNTISFTPNKIVLIASGEKNYAAANSQVTMTFPGANTAPTITGLDRLTGNANYFVGNDKSQWRTDVPTYGAIQYTSLYPGIDLQYKGTEGNLKRQFVVAPGADPSHIVMAYDGIQSMSISPDGSLELTTSLGVLTDQAPVAYQEINGVNVPVTAGYQIVGDNKVRFTLGNYNPEYPLVIDPWLSYSTYLTGSATSSQLYGVAHDTEGNIVVAGYAVAGYPTTLGAYQIANAGGSDIIVTKITPDGSGILFSTFIGGSSTETCYGMALDPSGNIYVTGSTKSSNFPHVNAFQPSENGTTQDAFVTKLAPTGNFLVYSTYLGGSSTYDAGYGIAADAAGNAYVTGETTSGFPAVNASQGAGGSYDAFVAKFNPTGGVVYSTNLGGSGTEASNPRYAVVADSAGNAYVVGSTQSTNFPVTAGAYQTTFSGGTSGDGYLVKYDPVGTKLYATFIGGSARVYIQSLAIDSAGSLYISGETTGQINTTLGAMNPTYLSGDTAEGFLMKMNASLESLDYSTLYDQQAGSYADDGGQSIAVDSSGDAYVAGYTGKTAFPVINCNFGLTGTGSTSNFAGYVFKMNPTGSAFLWSSYLGGSSTKPEGITIDGMGNVTIAGFTTSSSFPLVNALNATYTGGTSNNGFISTVTETTPAVGFTATNLSGPAPLTVSFTNSVVDPANSWNWDFGDGATSTSQSPVHIYTNATPANYTVSLTGTNSYGSHTVTMTNYIQITPPLPVVSFTANRTYVEAPGTVQFNDTSTGSPTSWLWNFGDGTNSTLQNTTHTYNNLGTYNVSFKASNVGGSNTTNMTITVLDTPSQPISASDYVNVYVANTEGVKYDVPNGVSASNATYPYEPNTYYLDLEGGLNPFHMSSLSNGMSAADTNITTSQSGSFWITFNGGQTTMPDAILMLAVNGSIPNDFAVNIQSSGQTFDVGTPSTTNQYQSGPPAVSTFVPVGINESFNKSDFIYGPQGWKPCSTSGYPLNPANTNINDPTNQFRIMFIDLRVGAIQNSSLPDNGMIQVQYNFTNLTSTAVFNGYGWYMQCNHGTGAPMTNAIPGGGGVIVYGIAAPPVASFTANTTAAYALAGIQFTDTSTNIPQSWLWNFGDGTNSTQQNPVHAYSSAGVYNVSLTVSNFLGNNTATQTNYITVTIPPAPVAGFTASATTGPAPLTVQFSDTSTNYPISWLWNFGDGTTSTSENPSHTYTTTGNFPVSLTIMNAGGNSSIQMPGGITVYTSGAPIASFTATPVNGVAPLAVQFLDTSTGSPTSWLWNFGDGTTSTSENPSHTYTSAGTYTVNLTATNSAGSTSLTRTGLVYAAASTGALPTYSGIYIRAANHEGILYNTNSNGTYYANSGSSGGGLNVIHVSTDPTVNTGQVTVSRSLSGTIYATSSGTYADDAILMLAVNGTIPNDFSAHITTSGYIWTPAGSTPASGSITYQSPALSETFTKNDLFYGPQNWKPTEGNANYPLFSGEDMNSSANQYQLAFIDLRAGIPGTSYPGYSSLTNQGAVRIDYRFNDLPSFAAFNIYGWKSGTGMGWTNQLTGTGSSGYSVITPTITIPPVAGFTVSQSTGLAPVNIQFTDSSANTPTSWLWNFGDGSTSTVENPVHTFNSSGTYTVSLTATNAAGNSTSTQAGEVTVSAPVVTTNCCTFTGIQTITAGSTQSVIVNTTGTTTITAGNFINMTGMGGSWSNLSIALTSPPVTSGSNLSGTVSSVQAVTQPVTVPITSLGNPNVSVSLNLAQIPGSTAAITSTITSDPNTTVQSNFTLAATAASDQIVATAYTVTFTKSGIANAANGGIISSATITMAASPTWVAANGGTSAMVIMHQADDGTTTILTTQFAGTDASGNDVFTAVSPTGLSTFILTAISPLSSTSTGFTSGFGSSESGGSLNPTSFTLTAPGTGPGQTMNFAVNEALNGNLNYGISAVSIVPSKALGSTQLNVGDAGMAIASALTGRQIAGVVSIEPVGVNPSSIDHGTITFALNGAWLTTHSLTPADIVMLRDVNGQWTELPTSFSTQSGSTYTFTATTPGFSYFAIAGRVPSAAAATPATTTSSLQSAAPGSAIPVPTTTFLYPVKTQQTTAIPVAMQASSVTAKPAATTGMNSLIIIAGGIAGIALIAAGIALIAAGGLLVRRWWIRRQNPALFRKYD